MCDFLGLDTDPLQTHCVHWAVLPSLCMLLTNSLLMLRDVWTLSRLLSWSPGEGGIGWALGARWMVVASPCLGFWLCTVASHCPASSHSPPSLLCRASQPCQDGFILHFGFSSVLAWTLRLCVCARWCEHLGLKLCICACLMCAFVQWACPCTCALWM